MYDGASDHFSNNVRNLLERVHRNRGISRRETKHWPGRSPD